MSTSTWRAPASGDAARASDVAQLQTTHPCTFIYQGTVQVSGPGSVTGTVCTETPNMLSANAASIETDASGWTGPSNCSISQSLVKALDQSHSLLLSSTAAGDMSAQTPGSTGGTPVSPSTQYTALASFIAGASPRSSEVGILWYTAAGALISAPAGTPVTTNTSTWTQVTLTGTSPSNAAFASVYVKVLATGAAGEAHYVDQVSLALGSSTNWTQGAAQTGPVYIDQPFTTASGQTTITRIELEPQALGTGADVTVGLYADAAGVPTGAALASVTFPADFCPASAAVISIPLNVTGLVALTKYHIVISGSSSAVNICALKVGAVTTNAYKTSTTGVGGTWTAGSGTLIFNVYSGVSGAPRHFWEDSGAHWTGLDFAMGSAGTSGPPTTTREYTVSSSATVGRQVRTLAYSSGVITTIT